MKKPLTDEELDSLLFSALGDEAMEVPSSVQGALQEELLVRKSRWTLSWWVPALAGMLQTAAVAGAVQVLFPGSMAAVLAAACGGVCSLSGCVLWGVARKKWKEEVEGC
ncbi:hypothetical protein [Paenibacillus sp. YN15]|uniref:hypothetical protein n=1 Tax=Paenibacillus sp. YN15 TaxID=1742774 RepID=UPI000DCC3067|nr:hypothetical protein [Paenibacillus sp. YN15]RAV02026.1 hypothetical protein DQG13_10915 [Paenibacillus sp. YN15]